MTDPKPNPASIPARRPPGPPKAVPEARHRRGEIWRVLADPATPAVGNEIWSNRPAIIVSNNVLNARSGVAQIVYLSTAMRKRSGPTHVEIPAPDGRGGMAMALCEQVHTVDASRLKHRLSTVSDEDMPSIDAALALSLSIGRNPNTFAAFRKWEEHVKLNGIDIATEIVALAGQTTDDRVEALSRALTLVTIERDSYRHLFEAAPARQSSLDDVAAAIAGHQRQ
jgi:mRNA-degrading endonuclease toxin of MazEF toxin-antitoxin module